MHKTMWSTVPAATPDPPLTDAPKPNAVPLVAVTRLELVFFAGSGLQVADDALAVRKLRNEHDVHSQAFANTVKQVSHWLVTRPVGAFWCRHNEFARHHSQALDVLGPIKKVVILRHSWKNSPR